MKVKILVCLLTLWDLPWRAVGMQVDLFAHKDKFGQSLNMDISERECTNVPRPWLNVTMSVDTHGSCMQFYDGKSCTGRIAVIQPFHSVHQMDLSLISFQNVIQSISPCGAKVPTGRYVIQSAVDASILTVAKHENQFAFVQTLAPRAFIPKAQQWEITEKAPHEYDIMPRIHETNAPITYDSDAMKRGSFIRKVWKIESVGRGRYIIKSDWTGKCLYKTRFRTIEEHDCRAWSPNQEWVLRPLLTVPKPTAPPKESEVPAEVKYQVPSRVVDQYLEQQKILREEEESNSGKGGTRYKIQNRRKKPIPTPDHFQARKQQVAPPKPEVYFSRNQPSFLRSYSNYKKPHAEMKYMEGMYPIYDDAKVPNDDPTFPDFLLHAVKRFEPTQKPEKYKPVKYAVTRTPPSIPLPQGHPNFNPHKPKYDGRVKDPNFKHEESEEEEEEDEEEEEEDEPIVIVEPEPKTEDEVQTALQRDKEERKKKQQAEEQEEEGGSEEEENDAAEDDKGNQGAEDSEEETAEDDKADKQVAEDSEEDPAQSVAGFMKLLFKGISNKMQDEDKAHEEMINTFERRR